MSEAVRKRKNKGSYFDFTLLFILLFLLGFGLVMVYSTSSYSASLDYDGDGLYYLRKQLISAVIGLVMMFFVSFLKFDIYKVLAPFAYGISIILVLLVKSPLGHTAKGATRWIYIGGFSIQPAEIVKIGVIMITAFLIIYLQNREDIDNTSFKYIFIVLAPGVIAAGLILFVTNNFSTAVIVGGIAFSMLIMSTPKCFKAYLLLALALIGIGLYVLFLYITIHKTGDIGALSKVGFRSERILAWFNPEKYADGKGYQTLQSLYGIGSGGVWGKGLGKSMQKLGFLPEAQNDMIFSIICEELGLFGGFAILLLFVLLLYRILDIATLTKDFFGNMLVGGVFAHIAIQVIFNVCVVTNVMPNTGISLPFISYGGSSIIFLLTEMGIVMNVARYADFTISPNVVKRTGEVKRANLKKRRGMRVKQKEEDREET